MRWIWLGASFVCGFVTIFFCTTIIYFFLYYPPTWRIIAMFSVVALWAMLTREAFLKFTRIGENGEAENETSIYENSWKNWALGLLIGLSFSALLAWGIFIALLKVRPLFVVIGVLVHLLFLALFSAVLKLLRDKMPNFRTDYRYWVCLVLGSVVQVCGFFYALSLASALHIAVFFWLCGTTILVIPPMMYAQYRQYLARDRMTNAKEQ